MRRVACSITARTQAWVRFRYNAEQGREQCPVRRVQLQAVRMPRCITESWWRKIKISEVFHASSHRDSRSHVITLVIRRKHEPQAHDQ